MTGPAEPSQGSTCNGCAGNAVLAPFPPVAAVRTVPDSTVFGPPAVLSPVLTCAVPPEAYNASMCAPL